jgi:hypothetical protein
VVKVCSMPFIERVLVTVDVSVHHGSLQGGLVWGVDTERKRSAVIYALAAKT